MAEKKATKKVTKKAPKVKAVDKKEEVKIPYIGATLLEADKMYKLSNVQRAALKPKATSISTIAEEVTGAELNKMLKRIKATPVSLGIVK
jgi:hypothetical protein|tara:strand:+ start:15140 stop:15409 length:270 start_codon:yes stop_codon:yes gene_type:complete